MSEYTESVSESEEALQKVTRKDVLIHELRQLAKVVDAAADQGMRGLDLADFNITATSGKVVDHVEEIVLSGETEDNMDALLDCEKAFQSVIRTPYSATPRNGAGHSWLVSTAYEAGAFSFVKYHLLGEADGEGSNELGQKLIQQIFAADEYGDEPGDSYDPNAVSAPLGVGGVQAVTNFSDIQNLAYDINQQLVSGNEATARHDVSRQEELTRALIMESNATVQGAIFMVDESCANGQTVLNAAITARTSEAKDQIDALHTTFNSAREAILRPLLDLDDINQDPNDLTTQWIDGIKEYAGAADAEAEKRMARSKEALEEGEKDAKSFVDGAFDITYTRPDGTEVTYEDVGLDGSGDEPDTDADPDAQGGSLWQLKKAIEEDFMLDDRFEAIDPKKMSKSSMKS